MSAQIRPLCETARFEPDELERRANVALHLPIYRSADARQGITYTAAGLVYACQR